MSIPSLTSGLPADKLERRLAAAEKRVRRYCGWHIAPVITETFTLDGSGTHRLFLRTLRVEDIESVKLNGVDLDLDTLEWSQDGYLRRRQGWPDRLRSIEVAMSHGFEEAPDVAEIVLEMAARAMTAVGGRTQEQAGGVSLANARVAPGVSGGVVLMDHEKQTLDAYKLERRL